MKLDLMDKAMIACVIWVISILILIKVIKLGCIQ